MSVNVSCPKCQKALKVEESDLGKNIKCLGCSAVFAAKAPGGDDRFTTKPTAKKARDDDEDVEDRPKRAAANKRRASEGEDENDRLARKEKKGEGGKILAIVGVIVFLLCGIFGGLGAYIYYQLNDGADALVAALADAPEFQDPAAKQDQGPGQLPVGNALRFRGKNYVELEKTQGLLNLNASFTVEMWVRMSRSTGINYLAGDEVWPSMSSEIPTTSLGGWVLRTRGDQGGPSALDFTIATKGEWFSVIGKPQLEQGRWYHVAVSKSPDRIRLYVNGEEYASRSCKGVEFIPSPTDVYLGARKNAYKDRLFEGDIGAFRLSSDARSQDELNPDRHLTRQPASLILLDFSSGKGTNLPDLMGAHPGTVFGAEWIGRVFPN